MRFANGKRCSRTSCGSTSHGQPTGRTASLTTEILGPRGDGVGVSVPRRRRGELAHGKTCPIVGRTHLDAARSAVSKPRGLCSRRKRRIRLRSYSRKGVCGKEILEAHDAEKQQKRQVSQGYRV